jgi:sulfite dehydrogenase (quinone) subunit SoeC
MHPALSVILFTTASGAGYGLLALTGLGLALDLIPRTPGFGAASLGLALVLITAGLLSSTTHLGHPQRAWRAMSQWRSSWLSREGAVALVTYAPAGVLGILWVVLETVNAAAVICGLVSVVLAAITVYCTAMIYASLRPVRQWHNRWVAPNYLALALMTGALWLNALLWLCGAPNTIVTLVAILSIPLAAWLKERYWRFIDSSRAPSTPETATGLAGRGKVRTLDRPHTEDNYLLKEMGFKTARRHALKLRQITLHLGFAVPLLILLIGAVMPTPITTIAASLAAPIAMAGVLVERWLFFAEARHTVTLYYGAAEV